jgi:xanthine dehydrogenase YagR molybdenum-binding subunit
MTKKLLTLGHTGNLETVEVDVPDDTAAPWDAQAALVVVGKPHPRLDGRAKATGQALYTTDVRLPGMLFGEIVRSPHPCARVVAIDTSKAAAMQGVRAVYAVAQAGERVRYEGQEIVGVAADSPALARAAARAVRVDYEVAAHVVELEAAMLPDAPLVYGTADETPGKGKLPVKGNLRGPATGGKRFAGAGDAEAALKDCAHTIDQTYVTSVQTHSCLEPHCAVVAFAADGSVDVWTSTQSIASVVSDVAEVFDLPAAQVRVHCEALGGGFGSKFGAGTHTLVAAHLAKKAGRGVRIVLDRRAEHLVGGNRPSSKQRVRLGCGADGKLQAIAVQAWGSAGVGTGAGSAACFHTIYACENRKTEEYDVFTNTGAAAAFRAPGHPQGVFALESAMDELASALGIDPLELRLRNDPHPVRQGQWRLAAERFGWARRRAQREARGEWRLGVGCAASVWYDIVELGVGAQVEIHRDGSVVLLSGVQDIGGGIRTVIAQVVAEVLGLSPSVIDTRIGHSTYPLGPGSGGSKTTASLTPAVHKAAERAARKIAALAPELGPPESIGFADGMLFSADRAQKLPYKVVCARMREEKRTGHGEREANLTGIQGAKSEPLQKLASLIAGVQMAQVAVHIHTGVVKVEHVFAVQDCGRVMNPLQAKSQLNGGIIQGLSYALYEERILDPRTGRMLNANLDAYRVPFTSDVPTIETELQSVFTGLSSTGAMGLGEPSTVPTSAAVANAVAHALGVRVRALPITPERVLAALGRA